MLWQPGFSQTLHLIVFADTDDPGLSAPNKMNIANLELIVDTLCKSINLKNHTSIYKGNDFRAPQCDQVIASLHPAADDVVFFYFMGHGWNNMEREEPMLLFKSEGKSPGLTNSRNLGTIFEQIRKKGSRLTLVFGESCNSAINDRSRAKKGTGIALNVSDVNKEQLRNLFLRSRMNIMVQSCKQGQKSNSSEDGGWFFGSFIETYKETVSGSQKKPAQWETLLTKTAEATRSYANEQGTLQEPVFRILKSEAATIKKPVEKQKIAQNQKAATAEPAEVSVNEKPVTTLTGDDMGNTCLINRNALSLLQQELTWMVNFKKGIHKIDQSQAAEEFQAHYEPGRQDFYKNLVQKLNLQHLKESKVKDFTEKTEETVSYLDDTAFYVNDPQFVMKAEAKLNAPIQNIQTIIAWVKELLNSCQEH